MPHVLTPVWSFLGGALPVQLPSVQCPGYAKERKTRAYPSSSTCAHMACWVVAQKVPSSRVRGMYDAHLGAGDEWGKVDEYKMYLLLPC